MWTAEEYARHDHSQTTPCTKYCPAFGTGPLSLCQRRGCVHFCGEHEGGTGACTSFGRGPDHAPVPGTQCECPGFCATVPCEQGLLPLGEEPEGQPLNPRRILFSKDEGTFWFSKSPAGFPQWAWVQHSHGVQAVPLTTQPGEYPCGGKDCPVCGIGASHE